MSEAALTETPPAAGFVPVAGTAEVPPGWVLRVSAAGRDIALANRDGEFYALDNSCTHAGGPLAHNRLTPGCALECPWHNSQFDARTGDVVAGPARKPARTYPVQVVGVTVYVSVTGTGRPVPAGPPAGTGSDG